MTEVALSHSDVSLRVRDFWEGGSALAWAGIPVTIWRFSLDPGKEVIFEGREV